MSDLSFKKLTEDNWLKPDLAISSFVRISPSDREVRHVTPNGFLLPILKPNLVPGVPRDIRGLFEVARGALAYGYFFYPPYTLGGEQVFRVAEAAVTHRCRMMGAPASLRGFGRKLDWLTRSDVFSDRDRAEWDTVRKLRNIASHPEEQSILPPGPMIGMLEYISEKINSLST